MELCADKKLVQGFPYYSLCCTPAENSMSFGGIKIDSFFSRRVSWVDKTENVYPFTAVMTVMKNILSQVFI